MLPIFWGSFITLLTAWSLGKLLLKSLRLEFYRLEEDLLALITGSACLSFLVFVLCALHCARKGAFTALGVTILAIAGWRGALRPAATKLPGVPRLWWLFFAGPFSVYAVLYFFNALAPETSPDGATYHLGNVVRWWHDRGFVRYTGSIYANLSQGLELLFLMAFSFGRHSAAVLVHFAFLLALPWLMFCYGRLFGMVRPFIAGALLVFLSPVAGKSGTSAYNDLAVVCTLFALFYVLQIWDQTRSERLLYVAGLLAGFGYAVKYTAATGLIFTIVFVGLKLISAKRFSWRPLVIVVACAALSILPWMVKNWLWFRNPFSPFFNGWFPNPYVHIWFENQYRASMALYPEIQSRWQLPMLWSLSGHNVGGIFGPWLLLTPLALLALRREQGRRLLLAAFALGLSALSNSATRFMLPFVAFSAPALALVFANIRGGLLGLLLLHSVLSWPDVVMLYASPYAWRITELPVAAALRIIPEDEYLRGRIDGYAMARVIEAHVPQSAHVFTLWEIPQAYTTRRLWHHWESAEGQLAYLAIWAGHEPSMQPGWEIRFRFPAQPLIAVRVVQAGAKNEPWSISEMRVYRNGIDVPRQSAWPNPWDAPRAFDRNEATAWSTWQATKPGMYLEERFDRPTYVDGVTLMCTSGQWGPKLHVEGLTADGQWRTLAGKAEISERQPSKRMRRSATEALKSLGFGYVVATVEEEPGKDLYSNSSCWGITPVQKVGDACLFRLD